MTPEAKGEPPMRAHQEILDEEQTVADHVVDVFLVCCCIVDLVRAGIN